MADAHYFLGMTLVNQNKMPEAKKAFDTYMSLAPTGSHVLQRVTIALSHFAVSGAVPSKSFPPVC